MIEMVARMKVKQITRKTGARMFADIQVGDVLHFSSDATNGGRGYAGSVTIKNETRGGVAIKSQAELDNILHVKFVLAPVQEDSAAEILSDLYDTVQDMREDGDTDLRTVLHHIDRAMRGTN